MQLQDVGRERLDDRGEHGVVGVDAERDDPRPSARLRAERARRLEADMARALGEEDEADHVRAGRERGFKGRGVERPQILTIGVIRASFGQSARAVKGEPRLALTKANAVLSLAVLRRGRRASVGLAPGYLFAAAAAAPRNR